MQVWGAVWAGPTAHYWQNLMHKMMPGKDMQSVIVKVRKPHRSLLFGCQLVS